MSADNDSEKYWERYQHDVDLHRSYLDLAIKMNSFFYAITGAIVSFYFLHIKDEPLLKWSLILPFAMTVCFSIFYFRAAKAAKVSQKSISDLAVRMGMPVGSVVAAVLAFLLNIFFCLSVIVAFGLLFLLLKDTGFYDFLLKQCQVLSNVG